MPAEPATRRDDHVSRRRLLAACGATLGAGAAGGYAFAAEPWNREECMPTSRFNVETDWPLPNYDAKNTGRAPARSAPEGDLQVAWRVSDEMWNFGDPVVALDSVFVSAATRAPDSDQVRAYDLTSGDERWRVDRPADSDVSPVVVAGDEVIHNANTESQGRTMAAMSAANGEERWSYSLKTSGTLPIPITAGGLVYATDPTIERGAVAAYALDLDTGERCWETTFPERISSPPAVDDERAYFRIHADDVRGPIALDRRTGEEVWRGSIEEYIHEAPIVADGRLFVATFLGGLFALDSETGTIEWQTEVEERPSDPPRPEDPDDQTTAPPRFELLAYADETLVVRRHVVEGPDSVVAIAANDGELRWRIGPLDGGTYLEDAVVAGDVLYASVALENEDSELRRYDRTDGSLVDATLLGIGSADRIAVADGSVVVGGYDGVAVVRGDS